MSITELSNITTDDRRYHEAFWDKMRGHSNLVDKLSSGRSENGAYALPGDSLKKFKAFKDKEDIFKGIVTRVAVLGRDKMLMKSGDHTASWVPEGTEIPVFEVEGDMDKKLIEGHKLAAIIKISDDFIHSSSFNIEDNVLQTFAVAMSRAEERAIIIGNGTEMPYGLLHDERGAEVGVTAQSLTYDDVVKLFFSVKAKYRKKGKWIMNDETALVLRSIKDKDGNYLWNHSDDTILGKEVIISEFMPSEGTPVLFGDLSYYWIIDHRYLVLRELRELFVLDDQTGYVGNELLDGMLTKREAVKGLIIS